MGMFILRRTGVMLLTALCLTFIVFILTTLYPNLEKLAKNQGNFRMSDAEVASYLGNRGYTQGKLQNYGEWLGVLPGYVIEGWMEKPAAAAQTMAWLNLMHRSFAAFCKAIGDFPACLKNPSVMWSKPVWRLQVN